MEHTASYLLLHLSLIDDVGPATVERIVHATPAAELMNLYSFSAADLQHRYKLSANSAQKVAQGLANTFLLEQELALLAKLSAIKWLTWLDADYPASLRSTYLPPVVLYYRGILKDSPTALAMVGSRNATAYGKSVIDTLIPSLVAQSWAIISGGARGADAMAHAATVAHGGTTIAVIGSGLLHPYPAQNRKLFTAIEEAGGALVSPFPVAMGGLPGNFPARNRIIAGLSRGCIVIQAGAQSGARITAEYALQQGKEVFAVPGPWQDPLSAGCHALIQQGAKLVTGVQDILQEYGIECSNDSTHQEAPGFAKALPDRQGELHVHGESSSGRWPKDPIDQAIVNSCKQPIGVDDLIGMTGLPLDQLNIRLFDLQLQGFITQTMAGLWQQSL